MIEQGLCGFRLSDETFKIAFFKYFRLIRLKFDHQVTFNRFN